jgi:Gram-negative bacterial TonB protein C-terminal
MANSASLFQLPEALQSASTGANGQIEENGPRFLEIRTENGAIYLQPSRWQRIRLQWTFRHFHVLSPQVLSRADQRLVDELTQSAVVTPALPVAREAILGVVEKVRPNAPASANRVVTLKPASPAARVVLVRPATRDWASSDLSGAFKPKETRMPAATKGRNAGDLPFQQWKELGFLAATGFVVILASAYWASSFSSPLEMRNPQALSASIEHAGNTVKLPDPHRAAISPLLISPAALIPFPERLKRWTPESVSAAGGGGRPMSASGSPVPPLATVSETIPGPAPIAPSATPERLFIAELPQGHFAHPVDPGGTLIGELQLKALIGADGAVKEVKVLSGSPALAEAGVRAVRQWRYSPHQVQGSPVEVETQIKMNFFGQDAVSISSVPSGATAQRQ